MSSTSRRFESGSGPADDHLVRLADQIADGLLDRSLPKSRWTHEGHLLACASLVRRHGPVEALRTLRSAIPPYNEATGVANTPTGGYHDTITVYFVWAIDRLLADGRTTPQILADPSVERTALSAWWDQETLMSPSARAAWVAPTATGHGGPVPTDRLRPDSRDTRRLSSPLMSESYQVIVVGGGVSGLGSALALARRGHHVTVVERDHTPMPTTPDEAFEWDRRGAPQVRHSHAFLGRLCNLLRTSYPDVYAALLAAGATELPFGRDLPPEMTNYEPQPDDDELVMLACRRTTFEWVVRNAALTEGRVEFRTGNGVVGLLTDGSGHAPPVVTGVRLDDGTEIRADLVVAAGGRRSTVPDWLADIGAAPVPEQVDDSGIVYFSRFYRLVDGAEFPPRSGAIGGDLGYLKYGVFIGDNRTFSVTLAASTDDDEMRKRLADPAVFDTAAEQLVATRDWLDGRAEPITAQVHVMAGLLNRWRDYVIDGEPVALGIIPVGDAVLCTNPLYGRGCSTAFWCADLLADAIDGRAGDDPVTDLRDIALTYDAAVRDQIRPWYQASVDQDTEARRVSAAILAGIDPDADSEDPRTFMRGVFRDGLIPAIRSDAVVMRAFLRNLNLLSAPDSLAKDPDVNARVLAVWQERDNRPPEPAMGPSSRKEFLDLLPA